MDQLEEPGCSRADATAAAFRFAWKDVALFAGVTIAVAVFVSAVCIRIMGGDGRAEAPGMSLSSGERLPDVTEERCSQPKASRP